MEGVEDTWLSPDGFEDALIGVARPWQADQQIVGIYSIQKCIQILIDRDGMDYEGAVEFFEFNVVGAYVGKQTPIFVDTDTHLEELDS